MSSKIEAFRILVVDDCADARSIFSLLLKTMGYEVQTASTLQEGKSHLRASNFDMVFADIGLPDGLGWDLLEEVLDFPFRLTVAMSGCGTDGDRPRSLDAGFHHHLTRPILFDQVADLMKKVTEG